MRTTAASILILLGCFGCETVEPVREMAPNDPGHPAGIAYDPVSHVEVSTDSPWKSSWKGALYYFESEENQMRFSIDPEAYVPSERTKPKQLKVSPNELPQ